MLNNELMHVSKTQAKNGEGQIIKNKAHKLRRIYVPHFVRI